MYRITIHRRLRCVCEACAALLLVSQPLKEVIVEGRRAVLFGGCSVLLVDLDPRRFFDRA